MASDDPNRLQNDPHAAPSEAAVTPAAIEAAVARLAPEGTVDEPLPAPDDASVVDAAIPEAEAPAEAPAKGYTPVVRERSGPSPWLALPIGAFAGALAAVIVTYSLIDNGILKPSSASDLQPLLQRLTALEARPQPDPTQGLAPINAQLAQIDARLGKAEAATQPLGELQRAVAAAQGEVAGLKQSVQALTASAAQSATLSQQVTALSGQIGEARKRLDDVAAAGAALNRASAALVVLGELKDAILSGRPFTAELDAARAVLGASAGSLDPFAASASAGYASPAKLAERLTAALDAPSAPVAAAPPSATGSFVDRIVSSAENLVRLRPADSVPSKEVQSSMDAAVAAVRAGNLDTALKLIEAMPADVKTKLKPITTEIAQRSDAANTASALYQQALGAVSGKVP